MRVTITAKSSFATASRHNSRFNCNCDSLSASSNSPSPIRRKVSRGWTAITFCGFRICAATFRSFRQADALLIFRFNSADALQFSLRIPSFLGNHVAQSPAKIKRLSGTKGMERISYGRQEVCSDGSMKRRISFGYNCLYTYHASIHTIYIIYIYIYIYKYVYIFLYYILYLYIFKYYLNLNL